MSETRAVLVRLAAQHDINPARFSAFLDLLDRNLGESDAANVQEALRATLAPGYTPAFLPSFAGVAAAAEAAAADAGPAGPTIVFAVAHLVSEEERAARGEPLGAWDLMGIFNFREEAVAICQSDLDVVISFELNHDYTDETAFEILRPTVSDEPIVADLSSLFPKVEPKPLVSGESTATATGAGDETLTGAPGPDLTGAAGNDSLLGGQGNDLILGATAELPESAQEAAPAPDAPTAPAKGAKASTAADAPK